MTCVIKCDRHSNDVLRCRSVLTDLQLCIGERHQEKENYQKLMEV